MDEKIVLTENPIVGHGGWVTAVCVCNDINVPLDAPPQRLLLTASRDKSVIIWRLPMNSAEPILPFFRFTGHNGFVNDVATSRDAQFAASASDDGTVRIWSLETRVRVQLLKHHKTEVTSVSWINSQELVTGSRDGSVRVWNISGNLLQTFKEVHKGWITSVKALENKEHPVVISSSCDKRFKLLDLVNSTTLQTYVCDNSEVTATAISSDGTICVAGTKLGKIVMIDMIQSRIYELVLSGPQINALSFSPGRFWLCAATQSGIQVWNLAQKTNNVEYFTVLGAYSQQGRMTQPVPLSLAWADDGSTLFAGYNDCVVRKFVVVPL